jgi:hypothetical protein
MPSATLWTSGSIRSHLVRNVGPMMETIQNPGHRTELGHLHVTRSHATCFRRTWFDRQGWWKSTDSTFAYSRVAVLLSRTASGAPQHFGYLPAVTRCRWPHIYDYCHAWRRLPVSRHSPARCMYWVILSRCILPVERSGISVSWELSHTSNARALGASCSRLDFACATKRAQVPIRRLQSPAICCFTRHTDLKCWIPVSFGTDLASGACGVTPGKNDIPRCSISRYFSEP